MIGISALTTLRSSVISHQIRWIKVTNLATFRTTRKNCLLRWQSIRRGPCNPSATWTNKMIVESCDGEHDWSWVADMRLSGRVSCQKAHFGDINNISKGFIACGLLWRAKLIYASCLTASSEVPNNTAKLLGDWLKEWQKLWVNGTYPSSAHITSVKFSRYWALPWFHYGINKRLELGPTPVKRRETML